MCKYVLGREFDKDVVDALDVMDLLRVRVYIKV